MVEPRTPLRGVNSWRSLMLSVLDDGETDQKQRLDLITEYKS
jgi:hypothetical protein